MLGLTKSGTRTDYLCTNEFAPPDPRTEPTMSPTRHVFSLALAGSLAASFAFPAVAQDTIKIGELNSYKAQPAFLDPYKKGMDLALEEINSKGGVLGKKLELISRDDGANPGEAVRV